MPSGKTGGKVKRVSRRSLTHLALCLLHCAFVTVLNENQIWANQSVFGTLPLALCLFGTLTLPFSVRQWNTNPFQIH